MKTFLLTTRETQIRKTAVQIFPTLALLIMTSVTVNGCKSEIKVISTSEQTITPPTSSAPSLKSLLTASFKTQLISLGLTATQAEAISNSAAASSSEGADLVDFRSQTLNSDSGKASTITSKKVNRIRFRKITAAESASDPTIIIPSMVAGALSSLTSAEVGTPNNATKLAVLSKIASAFASLAFDQNLPNLTALQVQKMFERIVANLTANLLSSQLSTSQLPVAVLNNTNQVVSVLNTQVASTSSLTQLTSSVATGGISGIGNYTSLTDDQKSSMAQGITAGATLGLSTSTQLSASDVNSITVSLTSSAVAALGDIVPPASMGNYVQAISAGPVAVVSQFVNLTADEKAAIAGSSSKGATTGLSSIPALSPTQLSSMAESISKGAIGAIADNAEITAEEMSVYVQSISAGPITALSSFSTLTDTQKSEVAKSAVLGATLALSDPTLTVEGASLTATQISAFARSITTGAIASLGAVSSENVSTYVKAITNAPIAALSSFTGLSDSEKASLAGAAVQGATAGLGSSPGGLGLSPTTIANISTQVTQGAIAGLASAGLSSGINSVAQSITNGIQNGMLGAGLSLEQIAVAAPNIQTVATTQATLSGIGAGFVVDTSLHTPVYASPPSGLSYHSANNSFSFGTAITPISPTLSNPGVGGTLQYSVTPALPAGLVLDTSSGVITGTPSALRAPSTYTITATRSGAFGAAFFTISIAVTGVPPSGLSYSESNYSFAAGTSISPLTPTLSNLGAGGTLTYSVSPSLPAGLSLNNSTGDISGTPTSIQASASYTVSATRLGVSGNTSFDIALTITGTAPSGLSYPASTYTFPVGTAISSLTPTLLGTGFGGTLTYGIFPALPAGLSMNTLTGVISGSPSSVQASANYIVTASRSGASGSATFEIALAVSAVPPSGLSYPLSTYVFDSGTLINPLIPNLTSTGSGGTPSYAISPSLPAGLSLDTSTGVISGTPTTIGAASSYTVTATSSAGSTTGSLTITVNDVPPSNLIYSANPATYSINSAITDNTPSSSGGAVVSYSVSPTLPAGLSFSTSTGVISGTPTSSSAASAYTVTATNSGGSTTGSLSIVVVGTASKLAFVSSPGGQTYVSQTSFTPSLTVAVQDANGTTVTSSSAPVTIALVANTTGGTLSGTLTQSAVNGIATFNNIKIDKAASNYTMNATSSGLTAAPTTATFTVTAGAASQFAFTSGSTTSTSGTCNGPYQLTVQDASGNSVVNTSGSAWDILLSVSGSANLYGPSDSTCSGSIVTQTSVAPGGSNSGNFYLYDTVNESVTLTGNGTSVGIGSQALNILVSVCPPGYILVPGNALYNTPTAGANFCVMKYAASNNGAGTAVSTVSGTPWASINLSNASAACAASGAHLMTNSEWMTVARNIEATSENWNSSSSSSTGPGAGPVGTGVLSAGNVGTGGNVAVPSTDSNPYFGSSGTTWLYKRTHQLSNGNIIWDMGGNVMQWVTGVASNFSTGGWTAYSNTTYFPFPSTSGTRLLYAPNGNYNNAQGTGDYWGGAANRLAVRGGSVKYHAVSNDGIFQGDTYFSGSETLAYIGFRCAK